MSWWDLGESSGYRGNELELHRIECGFCGERGNFEKVKHLERAKPDRGKKLNYDTLKCIDCGNYTFVFWSASEFSGSLYDFKQLPWYRETTAHPDHWAADVGRYWLEARRSIEGKNWTAAALMARSALQLVTRNNKAKGDNLKQEIDDLAGRGLIIPIMKEWAHEVRELANEGTHPKPGTTGTDEKDARDVVEFLTFLMRLLYDVPKQIENYRSRRP